MKFLGLPTFFGHSRILVEFSIQKCAAHRSLPLGGEDVTVRGEGNASGSDSGSVG